jgi:hypothetical protein
MMIPVTCREVRYLFVQLTGDDAIIQISLLSIPMIRAGLSKMKGADEGVKPFIH